MPSIQLDLTADGLARTSSIKICANAAGNLLPRPGVEHGPYGFGREVLCTDAANIDADPAIGDSSLVTLVRCDGRRSVQGDDVPHGLGPHGVHPGITQQRANRVGAAHLETLRARKSLGQADIVQHGADVHDLHVDVEPFGLGHERGELKAPFAVCGQLRVAGCVQQVTGLPGQVAGRCSDRR